MHKKIIIYNLKSNVFKSVAIRFIVIFVEPEYCKLIGKKIGISRDFTRQLILYVCIPIVTTINHNYVFVLKNIKA